MIEVINNTIRNARAVIYKKEQNQTLFLLIQEKSGLWHIPGGCKDVDDQGVVETIKRELREELGINDETKLIIKGSATVDNGFVYDNQHSDRYGKKGIFEIFLIEATSEPTINIGPDIRAFVWTTKHQAMELMQYQHSRDLFQKGLDLI